MARKPEINRIIQGDCLEIMKDWPDNCVDLVLTDIPYNAVNRPSGGLRVFDKGKADSLPIHALETGRLLASLSLGSIYIWCGWGQISDIVLAFEGLSIRLCCWEKTNPPIINGQHLWLSAAEFCVYGKHSNATFNFHCQSPVWHGPITLNRTHPTEKPLWLMIKLIEASSNPNDLILDPFCGSGTTCVAAKMLGRNYIGIDISEKYCEIARMRLEAVETGVPVKERLAGQMPLFKE